MIELVAEYLEMKTLSDLGYKSNVEDLTTWEVEAFSTIQAAINDEMKKMQKEELDKAKRKKR